MLTAVQKIRFTVTGSPFGEPHFQQEGEEVVRWVTGGTLPDLYVTLHRHRERNRSTMFNLSCSARDLSCPLWGKHHTTNSRTATKWTPA